jgi:hypothetical protein
VGRPVHAANEDATESAARFRCLIPAAPAVPAAADKHHNDKYDGENRGGIHIHVELLLAVPYVFSALRVCTRLVTNPFDPYLFP